MIEIHRHGSIPPRELERAQEAIRILSSIPLTGTASGSGTVLRPESPREISGNTSGQGSGMLNL